MAPAVAYIRVSSKSQDVTTQKHAIERAARARGDDVVAWYAERESASSMQRFELSRLRNDVRRGLVAKVYVFRIDRLSRTGIRDTLAIVEEFRRHGCSIATVADGFSLDGPAADVILAVISWAAQMERQALSDRISAARSRIEAEGGRWGRPHAIDSGLRETIRRIRETTNATIREIAIAHKIPRSTVWRCLSQKGHYQDPSNNAEK